MPGQRRIPWWQAAIIVLTAVGLSAVVEALLHGGLSQLLISITPGQPPALTERRVLRVSPSDLFSGAVKRLQPHFDFESTGCVEVQAPEGQLSVEVEVWKKGKPERARLTVPASAMTKYVSVSLKQVTRGNEAKLLLMESVIEGEGYVCSPTEFVLPEGRHELVPYTRHLSRTEDLDAGERVSIWAYMLRRPEPHKPSVVPELTDSEVKNSEWALVVKIWWEEKKPE